MTKKKPLSEILPSGRPIEWTDERLSELAKSMNDWSKVDENFWYGDFEWRNHLYDGQLYDLHRRYKNHGEYQHAWRRMHTKQKSVLAQKGLDKSHDSSMSRFLLSACHGVNDKQIVEHVEQTPVIEADVEEIEKAKKHQQKRLREI